MVPCPKPYAKFVTSHFVGDAGNIETVFYFFGDSPGGPVVHAQLPLTSLLSKLGVLKNS